MMNTTPTEETVLKQDVLGRVHTPRARREQLLDEFERSGLSGPKFAQLLGLKYQTFATWAQQRRRQRGAYPAQSDLPKNAQTFRWLEAVVDEASAPGGPKSPALPVQLPGGARLELARAAQIPLAAALLRELQKPAPAC